MMVDDDSGVRDVTAAMVAELGCSVTEAGGAALDVPAWPMRADTDHVHGQCRCNYYAATETTVELSATRAQPAAEGRAPTSTQERRR